jgi:hypothetical protein
MSVTSLSLCVQALSCERVGKQPSSERSDKNKTLRNDFKPILQRRVVKIGSLAFKNHLVRNDLRQLSFLFADLTTIYTLPCSCHDRAQTLVRDRRSCRPACRARYLNELLNDSRFLDGWSALFLFQSQILFHLPWCSFRTSSCISV